ncbi:MAG: GNAT family N-acetyltransferase [Halanaerobiales bacterium]
MCLTIRKAEKEEIDTAFSLLREAAEWLREEGIDYWQDWHQPPENLRSWIKEGFDREEFYFAGMDGEIVGMFRLKYSDEMFWGEENERAGYIHSFTTRRELKGRGIGDKILGRIEEMLKQKSIDKLRLDCGEGIDGLCEYYENRGFKKKRVTEVEGNRLVLYEKSI